MSQAPEPGPLARLHADAVVFAALGDETRLALVGRLAERGPLSIATLTVDAEMTRQAVTKHLEVLASAGIVRDTKKGRERIWQLDPARLAQARARIDRVSAQWDDAIARLRAFVER
ncbi:MAG: metalloregulator ArsR/SmtB family transcription factor [Polyangiaceae bacterium]